MFGIHWLQLKQQHVIWFYAAVNIHFNWKHFITFLITFARCYFIYKKVRHATPMSFYPYMAQLVQQTTTSAWQSIWGRSLWSMVQLGGATQSFCFPSCCSECPPTLPACQSAAWHYRPLLEHMENTHSLLSLSPSLGNTSWIKSLGLLSWGMHCAPSTYRADCYLRLSGCPGCRPTDMAADVTMAVAFPKHTEVAVCTARLLTHWLIVWMDGDCSISPN